eukprot:gene1067-2636_t
MPKPDPHENEATCSHHGHALDSALKVGASMAAPAADKKEGGMVFLRAGGLGLLCENVLLAGVSNTCGQTEGHPFDLIKQSADLCAAPAQHPSLYTTPVGPLHGLWPVASAEGVRALYKGYQAAALREFFYSGMRVGLYEPFK